MTKLLAGSLLLFFLTLQSVAPAWAQAVDVAQIGGVVSDSSGASVPNAQIRATQTNTGLVRTTITGAEGIYVLPDLPIGPYKLEVTATGFKVYSRSGIELSVDDTVQINATLEVGSLSETVQVKANASMIEVDKISVSQVIDQQRIVDLPLNGRTAVSLVVLGGAAQSAPLGIANFYDFTPTGNFGKLYATEVPYSVAGSPPNTTNWLLDGADNNDTFMNVAMPYPFPDALQEFSVETSSRSARTGLHPGAVVSMLTKSGNSQIHGDLFEFVRNGDFNARNFFAATHDNLKRNQMGGTVGGPILKNKLFFFAGLQETWNRTAPPASISYVPTAAALSGDFSSLESAACVPSGARTLINPTTGTAFTNNFINPSLFNPSAFALLKYVPVSTDPCGKVVYGVPSTGDETMPVGRIDWNPSEKHRLFGRYFLADYRDPSVWNGKNILPSQRTGILNRGQTFTLGDSYSLSPTMINSLHLAGTRMGIHRGAPPNYLGPQDIGLTNCKECLDNYLQLAINGHFATNGVGAPLILANNTFQVADDVDMVRGRHHVGFGAEFFRNQNNLDGWGTQNGDFTFDGSYTGDPLADFMLGDVSTFMQAGGPNKQQWRQKVWGLYADDTFRVNSHFTLTAGLRWEPYLPMTDVKGRGSHFDLADFEAGIKTSRYEYAPPGLMFNSDPGIPHAYTNRALFNLGPRLGLSWDPTGKGLQTIRASYGILYDSPLIFMFNNIANNPPMGGNITLTHPPGGLSDPWAGYPGGNPTPFPFPPLATAPFYPGSGYGNLPLNVHPTYMQQWLLTYERQFGSNWLVSATYMGNKNTHIWLGTDQDPAVFIPGTCNGQPCSTLANSAERRVLSLINPVSGAYYGPIVSLDDGGNAEFNALLVSVRHRFGQHFTLLSNYTYSHCISEGDSQGELQGAQSQNPFNRNADRGNCAYDLRHIFNTSLVATSPTFGQGWAHRLLSNWQFSPIISATSGQWFTAYTGTDNSLTTIGLDRPNVVLSNVYPAHQSVNEWFNPMAFAPNSLGTWGNAGRDSLVGPGSFELDLALSRFFPLGEERKLEARWEVFNAINHANFGQPDFTQTDPQFGQLVSAADPRILQFALKFFF